MDKMLERYERNADGILCSKNAGYWSNLDRSENDDFVKDLKNASSAKEALLRRYPEYFDIIYSPKREAGLEYLDLRGDETCVDYGCMWGALTIPLAKRTKYVLGVDQTLQSLMFLRCRVEDEKLNNIDLLCENLNSMSISENSSDVAVVSGVLEWIPEKGEIELKQYYGKRAKKDYSGSPRDMQIEFLRKVYLSLKQNGKLYLAIENRYDFKMFMGLRDPHSNLMLTSILPRKLANCISMRKLGRPYMNWLYSFPDLKALLWAVGFNTVKLYCCFPDYHFPEFISPYDYKLAGFNPTISLRDQKGKITTRRVGRVISELLLFKYLKARSIAPAIIAIATKE